MRTRSFAASAAALLTLVVAGQAHASGLLTARYGADDGSPAMPNGYAIYYNPAALGGAEGTTITGDASAAMRFVSYQRPESALSPSNPTFRTDPSFVDKYVKANTGTATLFNFVALPFVGVNTDFGGKLGGLRAGWAFYVPYGGQADWNRSKDAALLAAAPGAADGPQRWQDISGQVLALYNTLAVAYQLPWGISLGASFSPIIHMVKDLRARNVDGTDDTMSANNKLIEGRALIDGTAVNASVAAGVYFDPLNNHAMKIGFSWTGQPGFGDTVMSGNLTQQNGGQPIGKAVPIDLIQTYPDVFRFGFSWQALPKLEVHSDIEYVRWSWFKRQCIVKHGQPCSLGKDGYTDSSGGNIILNVPANWRDTVSMRGGVKVGLTENLSAFASIQFATPAAPPETISATTVDAFQILPTLGLKMKLGKHIGIAGSYTQIFYLDVNTQGRSIYASLPEPSKSPSADGVYKSTIALFNANLAYTF